MKKLLLSLLLIPTLVFASSHVKKELLEQLNSHNTYKAHFYQEVLDSNSKSIATSKGVIVVDRKNSRYLLKTQEPDIQFLELRADGIYFYDDFLSQLTIYDSKTFEDSPLSLLKISNMQALEKYSVQEKDGSYFVKVPNSEDITAFLVRFNNVNNLTKLVIYMADGSTNSYNFSAIVNSIDKDDFKYDMATDAEVIDAR